MEQVAVGVGVLSMTVGSRTRGGVGVVTACEVQALRKNIHTADEERITNARFMFFIYLLLLYRLLQIFKARHPGNGVNEICK